MCGSGTLAGAIHSSHLVSMHCTITQLIVDLNNPRPISSFLDVKIAV